MGNIKQWAISSSFAASYRYRWSITDLFPPLKSFSSLCSRQSRPLGKLWDGINLFAILVLGLLDYINTPSLTCFYLFTFFPRVSYSPSSPPPPATFFFFSSTIMVAFWLQNMHPECRELSIILPVFACPSEFMCRGFVAPSLLLANLLPGEQTCPPPAQRGSSLAQKTHLHLFHDMFITSVSSHPIREISGHC